MRKRRTRPVSPRRQKRGQMKMSFGMIFSIILIIIFLAFGFYAIKSFLSVSHTAQAGQFINDIQTNVNTIWKGSALASQQYNYTIPSSIEYVCFIDQSSNAAGPHSSMYTDVEFAARSNSDNIVFYPQGSVDTPSGKIQNINIANMTSGENPYCIKAPGGKISLTIRKSLEGNGLVTITR